MLTPEKAVEYFLYDIFIFVFFHLLNSYTNPTPGKSFVDVFIKPFSDISLKSMPWGSVICERYWNKYTLFFPSVRYLTFSFTIFGSGSKLSSPPLAFILPLL